MPPCESRVAAKEPRRSSPTRASAGLAARNLFEGRPRRVVELLDALAPRGLA
jgi:hypothetical protein